MDLASFNSTTTGVCYDSCLNEIPLFNVADWQLPQDIMHVILEGILPLELKMLLNHLTAVQKLFTIGELNDRIESFQFGYSESKPSRIEPSHLDGNLRQNGNILLYVYYIYMQYCKNFISKVFMSVYQGWGRLQYRDLDYDCTA